MEFVVDVLKKIFGVVANILMAFLGPLLPLVGFILGVLLDPTGFLNWCACLVIDVVSFPFPTTPENMRLASLITTLGNGIPILGGAILLETARTIGGVFVIYVGIKIYKLIPFKAS